MSLPCAVVYVTGASRGLGIAIMGKLLENGVGVLTLQRTCTPQLRSLEELYQNMLINVTGSVTKALDNKVAVSKAIERFGHLDAAVLNAGIAVMGTLATVELSEWRTQFEVNVFGMVARVVAALPALRESKLPGGGRLVLMSSLVSTVAPEGLAAYSASKAAVDSLARSLKNEEPSITAVSIHPGMVATDMVREFVQNGKENIPAAMYNWFDAGMNAERSGATDTDASVPPEVPAKTIAWLAFNAPQELNGRFVCSYDEEVAEL
ncbi:NAD(P)-binding protein [Auriculariales sp. MPI-PUGE-AT-0066]|nr:NAD(P)-binding protein [Auriculariales sp. MPI-PUGE-AT-0066]